MPSVIRITTSAGAGETASVNAIADQTTLAAVTLGLTASDTPTVYAWLVNGATTGISDPTAASPSFTPSQPGTYTVTCTATIAGNAVVAEPDTFFVGDGIGLTYPLTLSVNAIAYT